MSTLAFHSSFNYLWYAFGELNALYEWKDEDYFYYIYMDISKCNNMLKTNPCMVAQHGGGSVSSSQLLGPWFDPELSLLCNVLLQMF